MHPIWRRRRRQTERARPTRWRGIYLVRPTRNHRRGIRGELAASRGRVRRLPQLDAEGRRLVDAERSEWTDTTVLSGDVVEEVRNLEERHERDIVVHGSSHLAQTPIEHDHLVDP